MSGMSVARLVRTYNRLLERNTVKTFGRPRNTDFRVHVEISAFKYVVRTEFVEQNARWQTTTGRR